MHVSLNQIAELRAGYTLRGQADLSTSKSVQVYHARDVTERGKLPLLSIDGVNPRAYIKDDDVLLTIRDKFAAMVADVHTRNAIAASAVMIIRPDADKVLPAYLAFYLNSSVCQRDLRAMMSGSSIMTITKAKLQELDVWLPDPPTQRQLAELDGNISQQREIIDRRRRTLDHIQYNLIETSLKEQS
jgi:hypothetical protein